VWVPPEQHKVVGRVLSALRRAAGVKQQELADKLGKPQSFVSSYEAGQRRVDVLELVRIAQALDLDPLDVFAQAVRGQSPEG